MYNAAKMISCKSTAQAFQIVNIYTWVWTVKILYLLLQQHICIQACLQRRMAACSFKDAGFLCDTVGR